MKFQMPSARAPVLPVRHVRRTGHAGEASEEFRSFAEILGALMNSLTEQMRKKAAQGPDRLLSGNRGRLDEGRPDEERTREGG